MYAVAATAAAAAYGNSHPNTNGNNSWDPKIASQPQVAATGHSNKASNLNWNIPSVSSKFLSGKF
jgi:hypothetical protein